MDYRDLGRRIRALRRKQHLTQEQLSERLDISASFLGHIERGTRVASLDTLVTICNVLDTNPDYLLTASLTFNVKHMPRGLSPVDKERLCRLLYMAYEVVRNTPTEPENKQQGQ